MNYLEAEELIFKQLPFFQKDGNKALKYELSNVIELCSYLGNPQDRVKCIHIAGTNGKGSCSHLIASILQESGLKVGLYTSPHLKNYRERFRINGEMIPEDSVIDFASKTSQIIAEINPTFFEVSVAMAFYWFDVSNIDIAVIEVGLGGRLDSTNIITPILSVITNIGLDHQKILGNTLEKIASEKAGIIKRNIPVVIGERIEETEIVFINKASENNALIHFADELKVLSIEMIENLLKINISLSTGNLLVESPLAGSYQAKNILTVIRSFEVIRDELKISSKHIIDGISNVLVNTQLKGRWQKIGENPLVICDTGHNAVAWEYLSKQIDGLEATEKFLILGFSDDKDINEILSLLSGDYKVYFCEFDSPRSMSISEAKLFEFSFSDYFCDVNEAIDFVTRICKPNDFIFIGGSTYLVAEIDNLSPN
jgi:dihydrofolate synthase/folylpolyglutamate synthase